MQKEKLRNLKRINATPLMVKIARENMLTTPMLVKKPYKTYKFDTKYDIMLRCQSRGGILMIAVFFPKEVAQGCLTPRYEIYCNPEGNEYITRFMDVSGRELKWSEAQAINIGRIAKSSCFNCYWMNDKERDARIWQNQGGKDEIMKFLKVDYKGFRGLIQYQTRCRETKIKEAEERQQKPWDEDNALVPVVLPGFERWAKHEATEENFIFYESIHGKTGYCSYCEKEVPLIRPRRNADGKCTCCRRKIKFKLRSKIQGLRRRTVIAECIQKIKCGFVIRRFRVESCYRNRKYDNPDWSFIEEERYFCFDDGRIEHYSWEFYKNKKMRFVKKNDGYHNRIYGEEPKLYKKNMSALKKTVLKKSAIDLWPKLPCGAMKYLYIERGNPAVEMLARIGMFGLAKEIMENRYESKLLDESATEIARMLRIDRARLKRLKSMNPNIIHLKWMQLEKLQNTIWPDYVISEFGYNRIGINNFGFLPTPIKPLKVYNYIKKQMELSGESFGQTVITWRDYYNLAEQNKWNMAASQIAMPKDLKLAHTEAIMFARGESIKKQCEKLEKKWTKVNGILPNIKKFEYSNEEYAVVAPRNIEDMVREGIALNHCMDHADFYYDRIEKFEAYPFFLRRKSQIGTPWYTLEVEASGNIRQKRTTGDNQNKDLDAAIPFLKEFMKNFKKMMNETEKEQGEAANKARIKEYEKLRKDGNKIWRGKLAGQLLVDVLEADFMEA